MLMLMLVHVIMTILYNWCILEVSCVCRMTPTRIENLSEPLKSWIEIQIELIWEKKKLNFETQQFRIFNPFGSFFPKFLFQLFSFPGKYRSRKLVIGSDRKFWPKCFFFGFVSIFGEILNPFSINGFRRKIKQGSKLELGDLLLPRISFLVVNSLALST